MTVVTATDNKPYASSVDEGTERRTPNPTSPPGGLGPVDAAECGREVFICSLAEKSHRHSAVPDGCC